MKKYFFLGFLLLLNQFVWACPACEKRQPKILRGIAHGAGPESQWDYVIVWITVIVTIISLYFAIKWLIKPGEAEPNHIKRTFLTFE